MGAILLYISVIFFVFPTTNPLVSTFACHVSKIRLLPSRDITITVVHLFFQFRIWTQTLGYFLCFGTIVAKMWRIYFIFYHPRVKITNAKQMVLQYSHTLVLKSSKAVTSRT